MLGERGHILRAFKRAERACSLGVRLPFWNLLPVEMRHLFQKMYVVQQKRILRSD